MFMGGETAMPVSNIITMDKGVGLFFCCHVVYVDKRDASSCNELFFLSDGNAVQLRFERSALNPENPSQIEDGVDTLMRQFHYLTQGK